MTVDLFNPPTLEEIEKIHGPQPVPGRALTPEEQALAAARPPPKPKYYRKGERWARQRLLTLMGADLTKNTDELKSYEKDGEVFFYRTGDGVDYSGRMLLQWDGAIRAVPVEMEVKTFQNSFPLDALERQHKALDKARRNALVLVCLVEHQRGVIVRGWYIPWRRPGDHNKSKIIKAWGVADYADIAEALQARIEGNYKGKSIRHQDYDLLTEHLVDKVNGRWQICPWLEQLCPWPEQSATLF